MKCERENELLDALGNGFVTAELSAHVDACDACTELRTVAGALLGDRVAAIKEATVPNSATMWWRLQMRHRQEVQAATRRSLFLGQAATLIIAIGLVAALFGADITAGVRHVIASIRLSTPLLIALASWFIFAPLAGYIAIRQK